MTGLPTPVPLPLPVVVDPADVLATVKGLTPGWYRARDLHPRYAVLAHAAGHVVGDTKKLGEALWRTRRFERRYVHDHVTAYLVTEELAAGS